MSNLAWGKERSIENSLAEFLQSASSSLTVIDENGNQKPLSVRVGSEFNDNWTLPIISFYSDSRLAPRLAIGSNLRQKDYLLIIDIRALDVGMQQDLTDWLMTTINDGFPFYDYTPNVSNPQSPTKVLSAHASIEFITNVPVRFGETADLPDKYRQNITISVFLE